jgi:hypothetical protein
MTSADQNSKLEQLKKALGGASETEKGLLNPALEAKAFPKKNNVPFQLVNKFDSNPSHNAKSALDPKGKNKQVLKGNAKARR